MAQKIEFRFLRGVASRWHEVNPILSAGEPGVETDTHRFKVGDGFKAWRDLEYIGEIDYAGTGSGTTDPRVGNMNELTTDARATIVAAINELNEEGIPFDIFYENVKAG